MRAEVPITQETSCAKRGGKSETAVSKGLVNVVCPVSSSARYQQCVNSSTRAVYVAPSGCWANRTNSALKVTTTFPTRPLQAKPTSTVWPSNACGSLTDKPLSADHRLEHVRTQSV